MNSMVSRLLTIITGDLAFEFSNVRTASNKQTYNQDDQFYKYTRLPVTRRVGSN